MSPVSTAPDANARCATTRFRKATFVATPTISYSSSASPSRAQRRMPILAVNDELGDHRIVIRRDRVAGANPGVDAHRGPLGRTPQVRERADRGQEPALGVFRVNARLDRVTAELNRVLLLGQGLARGDPKLPFDEILAGDHFGDRVLDLQPRVHLHEIERAVARERVRGDELDRAGAHVADRLCARDRGVPHRAAMLGVHERRGCFLQDFLVSSLHRAIALEEVDRVAVRVGEHLDLDVAGRGQVFLDQHAIVAEAGFRFALRGSERRGEVGGTLDDLHSLAAAAGGRLDQHGVADRARFARELPAGPGRRRDSPARAGRRPCP